MDDRLYHRVPAGMAGDTLYPLSALKGVHPKLAAAEAKKYESREQLMLFKLPILNCLWNDVLHLSPVDPRKIKRALIESGESPKELPSSRFFVIDPRRLDPKRAIHFRNSKDTGDAYDFPESDFAPFDPALYRELDDVSAEQRAYYKTTLDKKAEKPLLWSRTPHVLYRGNIPIAGLKTIEW